MIVGQNALLNQYVPTFYIKDIRDGQTLRYDSARKAFINATGSGGSGATRLGELDDVSPSVDNPLSLQNGQALVYNDFTSLWENTFVDYNTLLNQPTLNTFLPDQAGNAGEVLTTDGTNAYWAPVSGGGTVTSITTVGNNGITVSGSPITTSGTFTLGLGNITPASVSSVGPVLGSNLSGVNTGDQTITISGDATGSGIGPITLTLNTVNLTPGVYGNSHFVPTITVNAKGLVTAVTTQHVDTTVRDYIEEAETVVVSPRHQYIVTSQLEVDGLIENYGVIAIL